MIIVSVVGISKSGKTTTIEYLTSGLTRDGYRVGSIKHIHHPDFTIDREGTDTWRHMRAGARVTIALAPKEVTIIRKIDGASIDLDGIIKLIEGEELDIVFIEGLHSLTARRPDIPKIVVAKDQEDLIKILEGTGPVLAITGIIAKRGVKVSGVNAPIIDLEREGELLLKLVKKYIEEEREKKADKTQ